tara:strand:- start:8610 stop:8798 length:189 start_codon:yes stop_codon:yes gene_type:complete
MELYGWLVTHCWGCSYTYDEYLAEYVAGCDGQEAVVTEEEYASSCAALDKELDELPFNCLGE